jgi:hypothetical protein
MKIFSAWQLCKDFLTKLLLFFNIDVNEISVDIKMEIYAGALK